MKNVLSRLLSSEKKQTDIELGIVDANTPFAIREAYKALYTNILYLNIESECKKIAVTSSFSGEAKSTMTANLAVTFAQNAEDKRILVIDTDMRKPKVATLFGVDKKSRGLSEYLAGLDEEPNFINLPEYKLTILTSGASNVNPTKLIGSRRMAEFLHKCEGEFDYVFIDTPPINVVTDAILLNGHVDGYVISAREDHSNVVELNDCLETLNRIGAEVYGIVLSSAKIKAGSKKYARYGSN